MGLKKKLGKLIISLIEINKLADDARGTHDELIIAIEETFQKVAMLLLEINKY